MDRELDRLSAAAARVQADLRRTTGRPWRCSVDAAHLLTVTDGTVTGRVVLDAEVEDEEWFVPAGATPAERDAGLDADADEVVAGEVTAALRDHGVEWPRCPDHHRQLGACSGWWTCEGGASHDVAEVGSLQAG
ncbi:hypothetical protein [Modestobacter versicolor]|uniref:hypothetical protein n=1 Tax=Modestobacter versicolor TaxID=429133 RepID=UPI0034DE8A31